MSANDVLKEITAVAQELILADPADLRTLANLVGRLEQLAEQKSQECSEFVPQTARAVADLLKKVILGETAALGPALDAAARGLAAMQLAAEGETDPQRLTLPPQLAKSVSVSTPEPLPPGSVPSNVDEDIFALFLSEQKSTLEEIESQVLALEQGVDPEAMAALRRVVHTLKGEAGVLGLNEISRVCHAVEDFLEAAGQPVPTDPLFAVKDWLTVALEDYASRKPLSAPVDDLLSLLKAAGECKSVTRSDVAFTPQEPAGGGEEVALEADPSLLADFIIEAREHLEAVDINLLTLEDNAQDQEALNAVFRAFHTIKGVAGFLNLEHIGNLAHEAETLLGRVQKGELPLIGGSIDVIFDANDMLKRLIADVSAAMAGNTSPVVPAELPRVIADIRAATEGKPTTSPEENHLPPTKKRLGEILVDSGKVDPDNLTIALAEQAADPQRELLGKYLIRDGAVAAKEIAHALRHQRGELVDRRVQPADGQERQADRRQGVQVRDTVRVDTDRLDLLVDAIGELVIAESMVAQDPEILRSASPRVVKNLRQLSKVSRELQEMGTAMRMETVRGIFQKMARLTRDLAKKSAKEIEFRISGEDTELDRSVIDRIGDPLIHMIRNAVDHGIESPEDRRAAGKPEEGMVHLCAYHQGGNVHIEVKDDGRGLDVEAILAKARERGLISGTDTPSTEDIYNLIFEPGFSTAKKVTDVSGRGVGMDVVRRNIEALRGHVAITSDFGKGSTFRITLPLTLAIIDGMVIKVGGQRFIIPVSSIIRSLRPAAEMISTVGGKGEMLSIHGELLPLFRTDRLFGLANGEQDPTRALVIVLQSGRGRAAILVDELLGQQQTVIKSLSSALGKREFVSGAAIMSDGRVGLILDAEGIMKLAVNEHTPVYTGEG